MKNKAIVQIFGVLVPTNQPSLLHSCFWTKEQLLFAFFGNSVLNYEKQSKSLNIFLCWCQLINPPPAFFAFLYKESPVAFCFLG